MAHLLLENDYYRLEFDPEFGKLVRLRDKAGDYELIAEPRLAENFRLLLPLPELECNYIDGRQQRLSTHQATPNSLTLCWDGPLRNERGEFALRVMVQIELIEEEARFHCEVANNTEQVLTEVWYPIITGMQGIGQGETARDTEAFLPRVSDAWVQPIFRDFGNTRGETLGLHTGEHSFGYPSILSMPWANLYNPALDRSIYFAALEEMPRVKTIRFTLEPGMGDMRPAGNWPRPDDVGDLPVGLTMDWDHFPFTKPGDIFSGATIVLRSHTGDWREAARIYREWFEARYPLPDLHGTWLHRETAFLDTMFLLPQDNVILPFNQIPQWAQTAVDYGLGSVMISGWNIGGHDRGYPYYEPDPRLGTWDELQAGVQACHDLGLRVYFFVNCQPVDMTTPWYKEELHNYRILDPHGEQYFIINYWGMGTLSARHRFINATPFSEMNPAHPEVRALLIRQFLKLMEIGADGLHIDKFFQTPFDFNPRLKNTNPDRAHHEGILKFLDELVAACRAINPEFCFSYEGGWDRLYSYSDVSWWGGDRPMKAMFPLSATTLGVPQPYDFNKVNSAVLEGANLLVGPAHYMRGLDYPPARKLMSYIGEITRIRRELLPIVSRGEKLDASDGIFHRRRDSQLKVDDGFLRHGARWSVFRDPATGRRAAVLANFQPQALEATGVGLAGNDSGACQVYHPFQPVHEARFPVSLTIPGEQAVFVVER